MSDRLLPFQFESETQSTGLIDSAGLPVYLELMAAIGLPERIEQCLGRLRPSQGWTSLQQVTSLVLMQLAGGEALEHLRRLERDEGLCEVIDEVEQWGQYPTHRQQLDDRWRIEKERSFPSPGAVSDYLKAFDSGTEGARRQAEGAFVPEPSPELEQLRELVGWTGRLPDQLAPRQTLTIDMDACVIESHKRSAKNTYNGKVGFQPLNAYLAEHGTVIGSEFRDGNCPAGWNNLELLKQVESQLPTAIDTLRLRTDTAGYDTDLLKYCADAKSERFGRIEFVTGVDVTKSFKEDVRTIDQWQSYVHVDRHGEEWTTAKQWARVPHVPDWLGYTKRDLGIRFFAIRVPLAQQEVFEEEGPQKELPFPTMEFADLGPSKVFGVVTNRPDLGGNAVLNWHRGRCGWSEKFHSEAKYSLAGGRLPFSDCFQGNAAWWQINLLAYNLHVLMQRFGVGDELEQMVVDGQQAAPQADQMKPSEPEDDSPGPEQTETTQTVRRKSRPEPSEGASETDESGWPQTRSPAVDRIKTERFEWVRVSGRVIRHAGLLRVRLTEGHPALEQIERARRNIAYLAEMTARGPPNRWLTAG